MENAHLQTTEAGAIDQCHFNPEYPPHETQPARLLAALLQGRHINPLTGWKTLGIYRLSDTVYQLRGMGWPVVTNRLDVSNRFNEACHVAQYFLPVEAIAGAGQNGFEYSGLVMQFMSHRVAA